jgi:hypothetical protein
MVGLGLSNEEMIAAVGTSGVDRDYAGCLDTDPSIPAVVRATAKAHLVDVPDVVDVPGPVPGVTAGAAPLPAVPALRSAMRAYHLGHTDEAKQALNAAAAPKDPAIAAVTRFLANPVGGVQLGGWKVTASTDEMTGTRNVYAQLAAIAPLTVRGRSVRPHLLLRCTGEEFEAYVTTGAMVSPDYGELFDVTTRVRFDESPAQSVIFARSDDYTALFVRGFALDLFRAELRSAARVLVEIPYYQAGSSVAKFDLAASALVVEMVSGACAVQ